MEYSFNNLYITRDGEPWFPVMGEIHYSRYPRQYWKESVYKMKAGGVDIVSCYVIWIHHEEIEGEYDFSGDRDLRSFIQTVKECGVKLLLRIGPWAHGEVRNGGFPDWLLKKGIDLRTNDPAYLELVGGYYRKIFEQAQGYLEKDGGPIIGIQIENEYGHVGGLQGEEGELHMRNLKALAVEAGFDVPLYTATGWGGAVTGGMLPVMGGYCDAPWDQRITEIEPSGNFIFTPERNDHNIGSDFGFGHGITFDLEKFPFLTAELGGGLQVTHHRRPIATGKDVGAMSLTKMGSGCSLLGYYMYHGGTNPDGKLTTLQESRATGYANDLPVKSYDFNAPVKEFGQLSESYREIRLLTTFLHDFGTDFCRMKPHFPENNPLYPINRKDLRYTVRRNENSGYLFVNNYQRRQEMAAHKQVKMVVENESERIEFPAFDVENGAFFFFPFGMKLNENAVLRMALATPFCRLNQEAWVFYGDCAPQFEIEGSTEGITLLHLSRREALNASKVVLDKEYLVISENDVIPMGDGLHFQGMSNELKFKTWPALTKEPDGFSVEYQDGYGIYTKDMTAVLAGVSSEVKALMESCENGVKTWKLRIPGADDAAALSEVIDAFLEIGYAGDRYEIELDGKMISDHFYTGQMVSVGLKRWDFPNELVIRVYPYYETDAVYLETYPQTENGSACRIDSLRLLSQWDVVIGGRYFGTEKI